MNEKKTTLIDILPIVLMGGLFVVIDLLAFWVSAPFEAAGAVAFENPGDWGNIIFFFVVLIVFTAVILLIAKYGKKHLIQWIFLGATGILAVYVFYPLLAIVLPGWWSLGVSAVLAALLVVALVKFPEWYVLDVSGILTAVGAIAMIGISLAIIIVVVLLVVMALYDAISVYRTKHMIDLADTLIDLKLPILFVIPKKIDYSLIKETKGLKEKLKEGEKRDAFFMGVGDVVIPGILASAAFYVVPTALNVPAFSGLIVGLSVLAGTLIGFAALMAFVIKGKPQAGLPFLCPGAIIGFLISSYLLFGVDGILRLLQI
jgi:presenilin-like A22 family membrane protease